MAVLWVCFCVIPVIVHGDAEWLSFANGPNIQVWTPNMPVSRATRGGARRFQMLASTLRPPVPPPQFPSARFIQPLSPLASENSRKVPLPLQSRNVPLHPHVNGRKDANYPGSASGQVTPTQIKRSDLRVGIPDTQNPTSTQSNGLVKGILPKGAIVESIINLGKDTEPRESLLRPISTNPDQALTNQQPLSQQALANKQHLQLVSNNAFQAQKQYTLANNQGPPNRHIINQLPPNIQHLNFDPSRDQPNTHLRQTQTNYPSNPFQQANQNLKTEERVVVNPGIQISLPKVQDGGLNELELTKIIGAIVKQTEGPSSTTPIPQTQTQPHSQSNPWNQQVNHNMHHTHPQQPQAHQSSLANQFPFQQQYPTSQQQQPTQNQPSPSRQFTPNQQFSQPQPNMQQRFPAQHQQFTHVQPPSSKLQQFTPQQNFPTQTQQFTPKQQFPSQAQQFTPKQQFPSQAQQFTPKQQFPSQAQQFTPKQQFPFQTQQFPHKQQFSSQNQQFTPKQHFPAQTQQQQQFTSQQTLRFQQSQLNQKNPLQMLTTPTQQLTENLPTFVQQQTRPIEEPLHLQKQTIVFSPSQPPKNLFPPSKPQGPPVHGDEQKTRQRMPVLIPAPPPDDNKATPQTPPLLHSQNQRHSHEKQERREQKQRTPLQTALAFLGIQSTPSPQLIMGKPKSTLRGPPPNTLIQHHASREQQKLPTKEQDDSESAESVQDSREKERDVTFHKSGGRRPTAIILPGGGETEKLPELRRIINNINDDEESGSEEDAAGRHRFPSSPTPYPLQQPTPMTFTRYPQPPYPFQHYQQIASSTQGPAQVPTRYPTIHPFGLSPTAFTTHSPLPFPSSTPQPLLNSLFTQPQFSFFSSTPLPLHSTPRPLHPSTQNTFYISEPQAQPFSPQPFQQFQVLPYAGNHLHAATVQNVIRQNMGLRINPTTLVYNPTQGTLTQGTPTHRLVPIQMTHFLAPLSFNQPATATYSLVSSTPTTTTAVPIDTSTTTHHTTSSTTTEPSTLPTTTEPSTSLPRMYQSVTPSSTSNQHFNTFSVERNESKRRQETNQATHDGSPEEKVIEKIRTEEKIIWNGSVPSKIRTEERTIIRPQQSHTNQVNVNNEQDQRQSAVAEHKPTPQRKKSDRQRHKTRPTETDQAINKEETTFKFENSAQKSSQPTDVPTREQNVGNRISGMSTSFAELLASKMRFEKMKEQLYPHQSIYAHPPQNTTPGHIPLWHSLPNVSTHPFEPSPSAATTQATIDPNGRHRIRPGDLEKSQKMTPISSITPSYNTFQQHEQHHFRNTPPHTLTPSTEKAEHIEKMQYPYHERSSQFAQSPNNEKLIFLPSSPAREETEERKDEERLLFFPSPATSSMQTDRLSVDATQDASPPKTGLHTQISQDLTFIQEAPIWEPFRIDSQHHQVIEAKAANSITTTTLKPTTTFKPTTPIPSTIPPPTTTTTATPTTLTSPTTTTPIPITTKITQELPTSTKEPLRTFPQDIVEQNDDTKPITWRPTPSHTQALPLAEVPPHEKQKVAPLGAETLHALMRGLSHQRLDWDNKSPPQGNDVGASYLYAVSNGMPQQLGDPTPSMQPHYHNPMLMSPIQTHPILVQTHPYQIQFQQFPYDTIQPQLMRFYSQSQPPIQTPTLNEQFIPDVPKNSHVEDSDNYNYYQWEEVKESTTEPTTEPTTVTTTVAPLDKRRPRYRNKYRIPTQIPRAENKDDSERLIPVYVHKPRRQRKRTTTTTTTTTTTEVPSDEYDDTRENDAPTQPLSYSTDKKATSAPYTNYPNQENHEQRQQWQAEILQPELNVDTSKEVDSSLDITMQQKQHASKPETKAPLLQLQEEAVYEVRVKIPTTTTSSKKLNKFSSGSEEVFEFNPIYNTNFFQTPKTSTTTTMKPRRRKTSRHTTTTTSPILDLEDSQSEEVDEKVIFTSTSPPQPQRRPRPEKKAEVVDRGSVFPPFKRKERLHNYKINIYKS